MEATIGPVISADGVSFRFYSPHATELDLLLFDGPEATTASMTLPLTPDRHRVGGWWETSVPGLRAGQHYGLRAHGPNDPARGLCFDDHRLLLDPYARGVAVPTRYDRDAHRDTIADASTAMKSVLVETDGYDWEGDRPLARPFADTVIYEAHVRGMTANPNSGVSAARRGTYSGLTTRIPYLQQLGITAVELLPVFAFDALAAPPGLVNYWGYQPVSFFAPHGAYASWPGAQAAVDEFRDMVKAFHRAGIEVILDVVYNHTAEVGSNGPTFCWRGLANEAYYTLAQDGATYVDASGTGDSLDAGHPVVRRMVLDSLRYWVSEMHVDGFRFDLAAVLSRGRHGRPDPDAPLVGDIETDPQLAGTKLIAEAWDAGGLYQVGRFAGERWSEWNGRFRDDVRSFVKGDPGFARSVALRVLGSPDIYGSREAAPARSINFVTCHDGMTLNDLVSYDHKRNEANDEDGRDGTDDDRSWGCGVDGPSEDPEIERLRARQVRNCLAITFLSLGVPMLLMGDEVRRTQGGNNNAYCHDDARTWFDWSSVAEQADLLDFTGRLAGLRSTLARVLDETDGRALSEVLAGADVKWSGIEPGVPDLAQDSHSVALTLERPAGALHLILNAWWEPLSFRLPQPPGPGRWRRLLDTNLAPPQDLEPYQTAPVVGHDRIAVESRSVVCLAARRAG